MSATAVTARCVRLFVFVILKKNKTGNKKRNNKESLFVRLFPSQPKFIVAIDLSSQLVSSLPHFHFNYYKNKRAKTKKNGHYGMSDQCEGGFEWETAYENTGKMLGVKHVKSVAEGRTTFRFLLIGQF